MQRIFKQLQAFRKDRQCEPGQEKNPQAAYFAFSLADQIKNNENNKKSNPESIINAGFALEK